MTSPLLLTKAGREKGVQSIVANDRRMAKLVAEVGECGLKPARALSPYESLVQSVVYQQLHGNAARTIFNRLLALYPRAPFPTPKMILDTRPAKLRSVGLSQNKMLAIRDIARFAHEGALPDRRAAQRLSDEELVEILIQIRGVGLWTVQMMLIFTLGRADVWPVNDYGIQQGYALLHKKKELPSPKELLALGDRWKPYRSIASWYLWRIVDLHRERTKGSSPLT